MEAKGSEQSHASKIYKLGVHSVVWILYLNVCGGPPSVQILSAVGPLFGLVGLLIMPLLWSIPIALITCELTSLYPSNGGYGLWVAEAFGPFLGFQECYLSWIALVIDSCLYPVLAFEILLAPFVDTVSLSWGLKYLIKLGIVTVWTIPNFLGVKFVGFGASIIGYIVVIPFMILAVYCFLHADISNILIVKENATMSHPWLRWITVLYWNYSGFESISTYAVVSSYYIIALSAGLSGTPLSTEWIDGSWSVIAMKQGGLWLSIIIIVASVVGNMGLYMSKTFENSFQLEGMAKAGIMPSFLGKRNSYFNAPWNATLLGFIVVAIFVSFDFSFILPISNFCSALNASLEILAFYHLRVIRPFAYRPFEVPVRSRLGLFAFSAFPLVTAAVVIMSGLVESPISLILNLACLTAGVVLYFIMSCFGPIDYKTFANFDKISERKKEKDDIIYNNDVGGILGKKEIIVA